MSRNPKPWFRKDRNAWFVTVNGSRHNLGPDREEAQRRFHELMLYGDVKSSDTALTVFSLFDEFLDWTKSQRAEQTYLWYRERLEAFVKYLKNDLSFEQLKPFHLAKWVAKHPSWSATHQRNCMRAVQRPYRWAHQMGFIDSNPIEYVEKPAAERREQIVTPEEYSDIMSNILSSEFQDLVSIAWETGARPQELLRVEVRHIDLANSRWVFPPHESKIKTRHRMIYLNETALQITTKRLQVVKEGKLFRNTKGGAWKPDAVGCQFGRLKKRIGRRLSLYTFRHSFATRLLTEGIDSMTVATLLGHADTSMLGKIYQHLSQRPDHLLLQLNRANPHPLIEDA